MAIDTRAKRQSVPGTMTLPPPDSVIGSPDRLHVGGLYGGLAPGGPPFISTVLKYRTFFGTFFGPT